MTRGRKYILWFLSVPTDGETRTRRLERSSELGGDFLGYDGIDPDHFAVHFPDASGLGGRSALLSVSAGNAL